MALLEGDFATLSLLGFPLGLTIQLQQSNLNLAGALWIIKSSNSGFSGSHKLFLACTIHPCMPTINQPGSSQQDNDEEVVNDEGKCMDCTEKEEVPCMILPMFLKDFSS